MNHAADNARKYEQPTKNSQAATGANGADQSKKAKQKLPRLRIEDIEEILRERKITVRLEIISMSFSINGLSINGRTPTIGDLATILFSEISGQFSGCSITILERYIALIGKQNCFNAILEYVNGLEWDGTDRINTLYDLMEIDEGDNLSRILIEKWLCQGYALLHNGDKGQAPFGADGVLTLCGAQGAGKTSFFEFISIVRDVPFFRSGQKLSTFDKDDSRRCLTCWICELGEIERTMRTSPEELKAFVTQARDEYRLAYAREDVQEPRHANLGATANSQDFLIDVTGNRRFWTISIDKKINRDKLFQLDAAQVWAQIAADMKAMSYSDMQNCFRLTSDEQKQLEKRNGHYRAALRGQDEVEDLFSMAESGKFAIKNATLTEFKQAHDVLKPFTSNQLGRVLSVLGIKQTQERRDDGKRPRVYPLPMPKYYGATGWIPRENC